MAIDTPIELALLADFNRLNSTKLTASDVDISKLALSGRSGTFTLVPAEGNKTVINSTPCSFARIDLASLAGKVPPTLPFSTFRSSRDILLVFNKSTRLNWEQSDIALETYTDLAVGDTVTITASASNVAYFGSLSFKLANVNQYTVTGEISLVSGTKYAVTSPANNRVSQFESVSVNGVDYQLDTDGTFTYTGETGVFDFAINTDIVPLNTFVANITVLNKFVCWDGNLNIESLFSSSKLLTEIGDNPFDGSATIQVASAFNSCTSLAKVGRNFFGVRTRSASGAFNSCLALADIGDCDDRGLTHSETTLASLFSGCALLPTVPASLFKGFDGVNSIASMFFQAGRSVEGGLSLPDDIFASLAKVSNVTSLFGATTFTTISAAVFEPLTLLLLADSLFSQSQINDIPVNLLSKCTRLSSATSMFRSVSGLNISGPIFAPGIRLNASKMFTTAQRLNLSDDIFSGVNLVNVDNMFEYATFADAVPNIFTNQTSLTKLSSVFFNTEVVWAAKSKDLFVGCTNVTTTPNVFQGAKFSGDIPKGLFDSMANLTDVSYAFYQAGPIKSGDTYHVPAGMFDKNSKLKVMDYVFANMSGAILDGYFMPPSKTVTSIKYALSGITTGFPDDITLNGDNVVSLDYLYRGTNLTVVDNHLLRDFKSATTLPFVFNAAGKFTVKADTFKGLSNITHLQTTFGSKSIPSGMSVVVEAGAFDPLVDLVSVNSLFGRAEALTLPPDLFAKNTKITDASMIFENASLTQPVVRLFGPNPTQNDLVIDGMFLATKGISVSDGNTPPILVPMSGDTADLCRYARLGSLIMDDIMDWLGISETNHLSLDKNTVGTFSGLGAVIGEKASVVRRLWGVADASTIPDSVVTATIGNVSKLT